MEPELKKLVLTENGNATRAFNNLPTNVYPKLASHMNAKQLSQLSMVSKPFRSWIVTQPKFMGQMSLAKRLHLLGSRLLPGTVNYFRTLRPHLSHNEQKFLLERANYGRFRGTAYRKSISRNSGATYTYPHSTTNPVSKPVSNFLWYTHEPIRYIVQPNNKNYPNLQPGTVVALRPGLLSQNRQGRPTKTAMNILRTRNRLPKAYAEYFGPQLRGALQRARSRLTS